MKTTALAGTAAVLIVACAPVRYGNSFQVLDTDQDGYISQEEAQGRSDVAVNWRRIDRDESGQLDVVEFAAFERARGVDRPAVRTKAIGGDASPAPRKHRQQAATCPISRLPA